VCGLPLLLTPFPPPQTMSLLQSKRATPPHDPLTMATLCAAQLLKSCLSSLHLTSTHTSSTVCVMTSVVGTIAQGDYRSADGRAVVSVVGLRDSGRNVYGIAVGVEGGESGGIAKAVLCEASIIVEKALDDVEEEDESKFMEHFRRAELSEATPWG